MDVCYTTDDDYQTDDNLKKKCAIVHLRINDQKCRIPIAICTIESNLQLAI